MRRPDMPKEEFGRDFLLTIGSIYATRSFGIRQDGTLTAVFQPLIAWKEGVNQARCYVETYGTGWLPCFVVPVYLNGIRFAWAFHKWNLEKKPPAHQYDAPREECTCGFYSYSDKDRRGAGMVRGIAEITGKTLIGDRGFRSEKAQIRALLDPAAEGNVHLASAFKKTREKYPTVPVFDSEEAMFKAFPLTDPKDC